MQRTLSTELLLISRHMSHKAGLSEAAVCKQEHSLICAAIYEALHSIIKTLSHPVRFCIRHDKDVSESDPVHGFTLMDTERLIINIAVSSCKILKRSSFFLFIGQDLKLSSMICQYIFMLLQLHIVALYFIVMFCYSFQKFFVRRFYFFDRVNVLLHYKNDFFCKVLHFLRIIAFYRIFFIILYNQRGKLVFFLHYIFGNNSILIGQYFIQRTFHKLFLNIAELRWLRQFHHLGNDPFLLVSFPFYECCCKVHPFSD